MTTATRPAALAVGQPLTDREIQVLAGAANGLSNAEIARQLFLGEDTVKSHFRRVFRKLGARDRANAVWLAAERGVLTRRHVHVASGMPTPATGPQKAAQPLGRRQPTQTRRRAA